MNMAFVLVIVATGFADQGNARWTIKAETMEECMSKLDTMHTEISHTYPHVHSYCKPIKREIDRDAVIKKLREAE